MRHLLTAVCLLGAGVFAPSGAAAPLLQYSQDGKTYTPFSVMTGREKARNFYDYHHHMGHPDFGLVAGVTTAALYFDEKRNALSLIMISGSGTDSGKVRYGFRRLPTKTYLSFSDEPGEFTYKKGTAEANALFRWNHAADGLVFSGLENQTFNIRAAIKPYVGVSGFRLAAANGQFVTLDLNRPLYVATQSSGSVLPPPVPPDGGGSGVGSGPPPAVPEPSGLVMLGGALLGLLKGRRRR